MREIIEIIRQYLAERDHQVGPVYIYDSQSYFLVGYKILITTTDKPNFIDIHHRNYNLIGTIDLNNPNSLQQLELLVTPKLCAN